jgi:thioredoxin 1
LTTETSIEVTDASFDTEVLMHHRPVFVDFWASWCPPCKMMEPIVDRLAVEYEGRIRVAKVNVDRNRGLADRLNIKGLPTYMMFAGGASTGSLTAAQTERKLRGLIDEALIAGGPEGDTDG